MKHEIPKLKLEINSKILTVFLCVILLSSTVTGFANFITPESFAEESFEGIIEDSSNVNSNSTSTEVIDTNSTSTEVIDTNSTSTEVIDTNSTSTEVIDTNSTSTEVIDTNSTSTEVIDTNSTSTEVIDTNSTSTTVDDNSTTQTNSTDSSLDPLADSVEDTTSSNSTSTTVDDNSTTQTNSTDSSLDPLADSVEDTTSSNSTSTEVIDTNSTSTEVIDTNSTSTTVDDNSTTQTNSTDSSLDPLADSVEDTTSSNSTSTTVDDSSATQTNSTDSSLDPLADSVEDTTSMISSDHTKSIYHEDIEVGKNVVWHMDLIFNDTQNGIAISLPDDAQISNVSIDDSEVIFDYSQIDALLSTQDDVFENEVPGITIHIPLEDSSDVMEIDGSLYSISGNDLYSLIVFDDLPELVQEGHSFKHLIVDGESSNYSVTFETPVAQTEEETIVSDTEFNKDVTVSHDSGLHYTEVRTCSDVPEEYVEMGVEFQLFWNIDGAEVDVTNDPRFKLSYEDSDENGINDQMCWTVPQLSEQQFTITANINVINVQSYPTVGGHWTVRFDTVGTADLIITGFDGTTFGNALPDDLKFVELYNGTHYFTPEISGNSLIFRDYSSTGQGYEKSAVLTTGAHNLEFKFGTDTEYAYNDASLPDDLLVIPDIADGTGSAINHCDNDSTRTILADLQTEFNPDTHILFASTQFGKEDSSRISQIDVRLVDYTDPDNLVVIAKSDFEIQAKDTGAHNNFQIPAAYTQSKSNARYVVDACYDSKSDGSSATKGQAKLIAIENIDRYSYTDASQVNAVGNVGKTELASVTTSFDASPGTNSTVVLASVQLKSTTDTQNLPAGSLNVTRVVSGGDDVLLDKNFLKIDFGRYVGDESGKDESSSIQNFLLIGKDDNAPSSSTYKVNLSTIPVPLSVGATNSAQDNGGSTGTAVSAEVKLLVFQPSLVKYGTSGIVTTDQTTNNIGDSFSTEIPQGTELVVIAHAEFDDSSNGNQNADNFGLKQDGKIVSQTTKDSSDDYQTFELRSQGGSNAPSNFGATLLWRVEYAEQPPVYQLQVNSTTGNGDLKAMSKIISFSTVNEGRFDGPKIVSLEGTDPDGTISGESNGYSNGDVITLKFDQKTNRPPAGSKGEIDELIFFNNTSGNVLSIGNDYVGSWRSPTTLDITVLDTNSITENSLNGTLSVTIKSSAKLRDAAQETLISTDTSPKLFSKFGARQGPLITTLTASDDGTVVSGFSDGDKITVRFNEATNEPLKGTSNSLTKDNIDALFFFVQNAKIVEIGNAYTGKWINSKTLEITISDVGDANPLIGALTFTIKEAANLKDVSGNSVASTATSPDLSGTWGQKFGPEIISLVVSDPDGADSVYGNDDVITATFTENTNMKPVGKINTAITKSQIDSLFEKYENDDGLNISTASLGTDYSAIWVDAKTLKITIGNAANGNPKIDQFKMTLNADAGLKNSDEDSLASNSTSVLLSGTFGAVTGPKLTFIEAADPKDTTGAGFDNGDTITVNFDEETNRPNAAKKAQIDSMFTFSESIGNNYVGAWKNSKVFVITILDTGSATPDIGGLTITATGSGIKILNKEGTSAASTSTSLKLIGNFGAKEGPLISSLVANDPNGVTSGEVAGYNVGDTITVRFSEPTNLAGKTKGATLDKDAVDSIFRMTQDIGDDYTGKWETDRKFVVTVKDSTVDSPPEIDVLRFIVKESANLKDDGGTSSASDSVSPTLIGTFGEKEGPSIISLVAADPLNLTPSGYGNKDTLTILFSETTNQASIFDETLSKSQIDSIFEFSHSLGDNYIGTWITPQKLEITIENSNNSEPPAVGTFSLTVKLSAGLQNEDKTSLISTSSSPVLSGTFKSAESPTIFSVQISDPDAGDSVYSNDDVISIKFDKATNGTNNDDGFVTKSYLDSLFDYENYDGSTSTVTTLGSDYKGTWKTPFELDIIITDVTGGNPKIGEFRFDVQNDDGVKLGNAQQTSEAITGKSPLLSGSFAKKSGPDILSITADDPDSSDDFYSIGDTITIEFSENTNTPFYNPLFASGDSRLDGVGGKDYDKLLALIDAENRTLTKDQVDELFIATQELGDDYSGFWENSAKFIITILDDEVDIPPQIGGLQIIVHESGKIHNSDNDSLPSTSISPPLEGSFGQFREILSMAKGGKGYAKLPSGLSASIQLPSDNNGKMTFTRLLEDGSTIPYAGKQQDVIGVSVDIAPSSGADCSAGCPVSFEFSTQDATAMGLDPRDVQILHDLNGDGDFIDTFFDSNNNPTFEWLDARTTIIQIDNDRWRAEGTTNSNSKFAVGGVKALALGDAYSSINKINESTFVSLGNPEIGLGGSLHTIDLSEVTEPMVFQTDETLVFRIGMYEQQGINYIRHAGIHLNNIGDDLRTKDYDTSIIFDKYSEDLVKITDPNNLLKHGEFKLLEKDASLLILQFSMTFAKPMDSSNLYFVAWNEDRNPTYKTYRDILTINPLSPNFINVDGVDEYLEPSFDVNTEELLVNDDTIPYWVKTYVTWWSAGEISDEDFLVGIEYLVNEQLSARPDNYVDSKRTDEIPKWVRDYARWWAADRIDDEDFINTVVHLVRTGVISR